MLKISKKILKLITFIIFVFIGIGMVISLIYPIGYKDIIKQYSKEYDVDPYLVAAIINVESKYNKDAISNKEARGLMQVGSQTGEWAASVLKIENYNETLLFKPEINIRFGTWYIDQLKKEFNNNMDLVIVAYNAGSGNVNKWLQDEKHSIDKKNLTNIPFKETEDYLKKVKFNYKVYNIVYKNYMEKPDSINPIYIDVIIILRKLIKDIYNLFR